MVDSVSFTFKKYSFLEESYIEDELLSVDLGVPQNNKAEEIISSHYCVEGIDRAPGHLVV
jgi:hypothetical protein